MSTPTVSQTHTHTHKHLLLCALSRSHPHAVAHMFRLLADSADRTRVLYPHSLTWDGHLGFPHCSVPTHQNHRVVLGPAQPPEATLLFHSEASEVRAKRMEPRQVLPVLQGHHWMRWKAPPNWACHLDVHSLLSQWDEMGPSRNPETTLSSTQGRQMFL